MINKHDILWLCIFVEINPSIENILIVSFHARSQHQMLWIICTAKSREYPLHVFVSLFVWGLSTQSRMFHSYGDVTSTAEGLQILAYTAWHSWPLSSDCSLACHTHCVTWNPFIMVTCTYCWALMRKAVSIRFLDLDLSRLGFEHPNFRLRGQRSNSVCKRRGTCAYECPQIEL